VCQGAARIACGDKSSCQPGGAKEGGTTDRRGVVMINIGYGSEGKAGKERGRDIIVILRTKSKRGAEY